MKSLSKKVSEGWAISARPSLCSSLAMALLALAAIAPSAGASPLRPALTATNPGSPGASLTPRIQGHGDGIITSILRRTTSRDGLITSAFEPGATVTIYAGDSTCSTPAAIRAEKSVEELEGAGIEVTVGPDSTTTFYATIRDNSGTSPCSTESVTYRQVNGPPGPPVFSDVTPHSPADNNFPRLSGSADGESTVTIYAGAGCTGAVLGSGSAATFAGTGIQVPVADNSTTTFFAKAEWGASSRPAPHHRSPTRRSPPLPLHRRPRSLPEVKGR